MPVVYCLVNDVYGKWFEVMSMVNSLVKVDVYGKWSTERYMSMIQK
jgi:hypothetical protein